MRVFVAVATRMPVIGGSTGIWSFAEVTDTAGATAAVVTRGASGRYHIVDGGPGGPWRREQHDSDA